MNTGISAAVAAVVCTLALATGSTRAETGAPVKIVVPYTPAGPSDMVARMISQKLADKWGRSVIVENRPGGNTQIGTLAVIRAKPDGQTLLVSSVSVTSVNKINSPSILYDAEQELKPVAMAVKGPLLLLTNPNVGATNFEDFVKLLRDSKGRMNFSSASSTNWAYGTIFKKMMKFDATHVPYNGAGPAVSAIAAGDVAFTWEALSVGQGLIDAGKLKALAVTADKRLEQLPSVPTVTELGHPELNAITGWWGVFAPANTPSDVVAKLNADINEILGQEDVRKQMLDRGMVPSPMTPKEFEQYLAGEYKRFAAVSKELELGKSGQ